LESTKAKTRRLYRGERHRWTFYDTGLRLASQRRQSSSIDPAQSLLASTITIRPSIHPFADEFRSSVGAN
jgi:hypothetical protein